MRFALNYFLIGLIIAGFSVGGIGYSASVRWLVPRLRERGLALGGGIALLACFAGIALARLPLVYVLLVVGGLACVLTYRKLPEAAP